MNKIVSKYILFTGSLVDFLKTTEGSNLRIHTLIDMASQARPLLKKCFYSVYIKLIQFIFLTPTVWIQSSIQV